MDSFLNKTFLHFLLGFLAIIASSWAILVAVSVYETEVLGVKRIPANPQITVTE